jgi:hypothetical protein
LAASAGEVATNANPIAEIIKTMGKVFIVVSRVYSAHGAPSHI